MRRRVGLHALVLAVFLVLLGTNVSAAPQPGHVHFTAVGDFSTSSRATSVLNGIKNSGSDFTLTVGDLSYGTTGQEQAWCDYVTNIVGAGYPFELLAGNHESNGQNGNINDFSACLPNQLPGAIGTYGRQYYVDVPAEDPIMRMIMVSPALPFPDGNWDYSPGSARYVWTANAIDSARTAGIPWVVVGAHKPCLTVGEYQCDPGSGFFNMLLDKKVDLILNGHQHTYQRSHQLTTRAGCPTLTPNVYNAACVADSDGNFVKGAGSIEAVVGMGGVEYDNIVLDDPETNYFASVSGLNKNPTVGVLDIDATDDVLTANFIRTGGGTHADSFTITRSNQPPNTVPTASFTANCTNLACSFDGSASADPDGTVASYAWDWGDGTPNGSGATATHNYASAGSYTVTLTVTDNGGATGSTNKNVAPTSPPAAALASDDFSRTVTNGWGSAQTGGAWTLTTAASNFSVNGGIGSMRNATSSGPYASLAGVSSSNTELQMIFGLDKPPTGSSIYVSSYGRRVAGQGTYYAKTQISNTGAVSLGLFRTNAANAETSVATISAISGLTYAAGDQLNVKLQVTGTSPTTVRAKVWKVGTVEPVSWTKSATDSTAGLQAAGAVGLGSYLSGSATNGPITVLVDQFTAVTPP